MWWCNRSTDLLESRNRAKRASHRICILTVLVFFIPCASPRAAQNFPHVVINEVYYDHPGADEGWEFIELYNGGDSTADLTGARLEFIDGRTGAASTLWEAQQGLLLHPGTYFLVAGANRRLSGDGALNGSLENGPDAVRLVSPGCLLDLVGYGEALPPSLYEGIPAVDVEAGYSLARMPDGRDTDVNGADFTVSAPSPGVQNVYRRNLRLSMGQEEVLPCRGEAFDLCVVIHNNGLEPFAGDVAIRSVIAVANDRFDAGCLERRIEIQRGAIDSISLLIFPPSARVMRIESVISAAADQCSRDDTCRAVAYTSPGPVVVNEIMYRPAPGGSEWIEILNAGEEQCNIGDWALSDAASSRRIVAEGDCWIEQGAFLVLAQYPERVRCPNTGGTARIIGIEGGWPTLNDRDSGNRADEIGLYDRSGVLIERVSYRDLLEEERGRSLERVSQYLCSEAPGGIWHRCAHPAGSTPGAENSIHSPGRAVEAGIRIVPNPFCASLHGTTAISGTCLRGECGFSVRIFSMDGFELRRLYGEEGGACIFTCRWDGRDAQNVPAATGLYVCLVEFVECGGGVCRRERGCIAVFGEY